MPTHSLGSNVHLLPTNDQVKALQTSLRDKSTPREDFIFCADRLSRLAVEEGLNLLPYSETVVTTPTGSEYHGVQFAPRICGVSMMRSGEAMELALRDCCQSIRIGKVLIKRTEGSDEATVFYAKLPQDAGQRVVFLMHPMLDTGASILKAVSLLKERKVAEKNIIILNLFSTVEGLRAVLDNYPDVRILTTEVDQKCPNHFGQVYFGAR